MPAVVAGCQKEGLALELGKEFYGFDFAIWDNFRPATYNKPTKRLPSYVLALVEHENDLYTEQEWYKLISWYAPLKVLICYPRPLGYKPTFFDEILTMKSEIFDFHPRSDEEYLIIIGKPSLQGSVTTGISWEGHVARTNDATFKLIP